MPENPNDTSPKRPNVLLVMTDHTRARATAPGSACRTPNLDALAGEGVRFGRCYTPNAICSPARASLMTATYPSTHGMWDCTHTQRREWVNVDTRLRHFSQHLAAAGYVNGYFGKWHVEQTLQLEDFAWHEYDHTCTRLPVEPIAGSEVKVATDGYPDHLLSAAGRDDDGEVSHPAFDKGIDFIRRQAGGDQPFCCFVSTVEPHDPYIPPRRFLDQYDVAKVPISETLHDDLAGKPDVLQRMQRIWRGMTDEDWQHVTAAYWAVISFLDAEVGRIVAALREAGVYDETVIVFTSDHGDMLGGHGLATKGVATGYEEVYNIPVIVRAPGVAGGREQAAALVNLVDVGPTLLDLCGAEALPAAQGRSFRPILEAVADPEDWQDAYAEFFGQRFVYTQRLVWHGRWKYVFSPGGIDELYDLDADPGEMRNLADDPAHRDVLLDMVQRMWRKMEAIGDQSLLGTRYATLRTAPIGPWSIREEA
jgi:arylsulfatase A-like enzyme